MFQTLCYSFLFVLNEAKKEFYDVEKYIPTQFHLDLCY